jgi:hypothetical protein
VGKSVNINIVQTFNQGDAGTKTSETIKKDGSIISNSSTFGETLVTPLGNTIYNGTVFYSEGATKVNNIGILDPTGKITAGFKNSADRTVTGVYPIYFYKSSSPITSSIMATAIGNGTATKIVVNSTGTISIPYSPNGQYVAVAYPSTSTTKTKWYVTELSQGNIPGGVFGALQIENVNSSEAYWSGVSYKIHVTPILTNPSATTIQLRNS